MHAIRFPPGNMNEIAQIRNFSDLPGRSRSSNGNRWSIRGVQVWRSRRTPAVPFLSALCAGLPYTTVYTTPPWADFPCSISRQLESWWCQTGWRSIHIAESFPETYRSVLTPSWLSSNRAWKTASRACDLPSDTGIILHNLIHLSRAPDVALRRKPKLK